jgi:hypothetical protein
MRCPKNLRLVLLLITAWGAENFISVALENRVPLYSHSNQTTTNEHDISVPWMNTLAAVAKNPGYRGTLAAPAKTRAYTPFGGSIRAFSSFAAQNTGVVAQGAHPNPSVEKANSILQKAILAHGGERQILSVTSAIYEYQVESLGDTPSKPITIKTLFKGDSFFRSEASGDNLDALTILNGDKGWLKVGDTTLGLSRKEVDPLKTSMITQLRPELLLLVFPKRRYSGRVEENNLNLDQIEISGFIGVEYVRGRLSFDAATSRLSKYEYEVERESAKGKGIVKGEEQYLRYGEKDGLIFPQEILSKQVKKTSRLKVLRADFNSPLNENLFQDPTPVPSTPK